MIRINTPGSYPLLPTSQVLKMCSFCRVKFIFIIIRVSTVFIPLCCRAVITSQFSSKQTATSICFINPLAWLVGDFLMFSAKGLDDCISSPKAKFQPICTISEPHQNFFTEEKKCVILIGVYISRTWVKINCSKSSWCEVGAAFANMTYNSHH